MILTHREKAFDKFQHCFMMKKLCKLEIDGNLLNVIKASMKRPWLILYYWCKTTRSFLKNKNKTRMPAFMTAIQ